MTHDFPSGRSRFGDVNAFYPAEKAEFQELNGRLEQYIFLVKGLERENAQLVNELRNLHETWGQRNNEYKSSFSKDLLAHRDESLLALKNNAEQAIRARRIHANIDLTRRRIENVQLAEQGDRARCSELRALISKAEADLEIQRREGSRLMNERSQLTAQNETLYEDYGKLWDEIDRIRLELAEYQAREQRLIAEKEFLLKVQEREVYEVNNLLAESSFDARKFFENDIALAIRDIKVEYEASQNMIRSNVTTHYNKKLDEIRKMAEKTSDESKFRKEQIAKMENMIDELRKKFRPLEDRNHMLENEYRQLQNSIRNDEDRYRAEIQHRNDEYRNAIVMYQRLLMEQGSMSEVTLLELEIYRKMIDCEEKRLKGRDYVKVEGYTKTDDYRVTEPYSHANTKTDDYRVTELYSHATKHRNYSGDIRIRDCDEHGGFIIVENAGLNDQRLGGFRLSRVINGRERSFIFPARFVLSAGETVQVSAQGYVPDRIECTYHLIYDRDTTWGTNGTFVTHLYNTQGTEVANFEVQTK
ncbi:unnamed protein product [Cylicocyclus nassatus]|uniref:LTD domain-containing protein n=1 Tax=Cylicocyclus nassatus TaxID=53992 RepID=A0AA36DS39_CYLNA|nr:unnamed protein product [Cylicocyclus nassatus]